LAVRCGVIRSSFFESTPAGAKAYLFRHIILDWTDEQCIQTLGRCGKEIPADGKLLIVDRVVPARQSAVPVQGNGHHPAYVARRPGTHRSPVPVTVGSIWLHTQVHHTHKNNDKSGGWKTSLSVAADAWCAGHGASGSCRYIPN